MSLMRRGPLVPRCRSLKEQDWECAHQASVLANVAQAFESDESVSDDEGDRSPSSAWPLSCHSAGRAMLRP